MQELWYWEQSYTLVILGLITKHLACVLSSSRATVPVGPGTMYLSYPPLVGPGTSSDCQGFHRKETEISWDEIGNHSSMLL